MRKTKTCEHQEYKPPKAVPGIGVKHGTVWTKGTYLCDLKAGLGNACGYVGKEKECPDFSPMASAEEDI